MAEREDAVTRAKRKPEDTPRPMEGSMMRCVQKPNAIQIALKLANEGPGKIMSREGPSATSHKEQFEHDCSYCL